MIRIIADKLTDAVTYLSENIKTEDLQTDILCSANDSSVASYVRGYIHSTECFFLMGDTLQLKSLLTKIFDLTTFYDKFAEKNTKLSFQAQNRQLPAQYLLDQLCTLPEGFTFCKTNSDLMPTFKGEYGKCSFFILPNSLTTCKEVYANYIVNYLQKHGNNNLVKRVFKIFGVVEQDMSNLAELCPTKYCTYSYDISNLDCRLVLMFNNKYSKNIINQISDSVKSKYADKLYADYDTTLQECVVKLFTELHKNLSVAESLTGGLISSKIVSVAGASSIFYEGDVTYSISSKCNRLGINPHFIDEHGVVSSQVANEMALSLVKSGADYSLSTTGYAGPTADINYPVGLCYIGVGTPKGTSVYRNIFSGERNEIREQASNAALFLLIRQIIGR